MATESEVVPVLPPRPAPGRPAPGSGGPAAGLPASRPAPPLPSRPAPVVPAGRCVPTAPPDVTPEQSANTVVHRPPPPIPSRGTPPVPGSRPPPTAPQDLSDVPPPLPSRNPVSTSPPVSPPAAPSSDDCPPEVPPKNNFCEQEVAPPRPVRPQSAESPGPVRPSRPAGGHPGNQAGSHGNKPAGHQAPGKRGRPTITVLEARPMDEVGFRNVSANKVASRPPAELPSKPPSHAAEPPPKPTSPSPAADHVRGRPEITVLGARPMNEVGFRGEVPKSDSNQHAKTAPTAPPSGPKVVMKRTPSSSQAAQGRSAAAHGPDHALPTDDEPPPPYQEVETVAEESPPVLPRRPISGPAKPSKPPPPRPASVHKKAPPIRPAGRPPPANQPKSEAPTLLSLVNGTEESGPVPPARGGNLGDGSGDKDAGEYVQIRKPKKPVGIPVFPGVGLMMRAEKGQGDGPPEPNYSNNSNEQEAPREPPKPRPRPTPSPRGSSEQKSIVSAPPKPPRPKSLAGLPQDSLAADLREEPEDLPRPVQVMPAMVGAEFQNKLKKVTSPTPTEGSSEPEVNLSSPVTIECSSSEDLTTVSPLQSDTQSPSRGPTSPRSHSSGQPSPVSRSFGQASPISKTSDHPSPEGKSSGQPSPGSRSSSHPSPGSRSSSHPSPGSRSSNMSSPAMVPRTDPSPSESSPGFHSPNSSSQHDHDPESVIEGAVKLLPSVTSPSKFEDSFYDSGINSSVSPEEMDDSFYHDNLEDTPKPKEKLKPTIIRQSQLKSPPAAEPEILTHPKSQEAFVLSVNNKSAAGEHKASSIPPPLVAAKPKPPALKPKPGLPNKPKLAAKPGIKPDHLPSPDTQPAHGKVIASVSSPVSPLGDTTKAETPSVVSPSVDQDRKNEEQSQFGEQDDAKKMEKPTGGIEVLPAIKFVKRPTIIKAAPKPVSQVINYPAGESVEENEPETVTVNKVKMDSPLESNNNMLESQDQKVTVTPAVARKPTIIKPQRAAAQPAASEESTSHIAAQQSQGDLEAVPPVTTSSLEELPKQDEVRENRTNELLEGDVCKQSEKGKVTAEPVVPSGGAVVSPKEKSPPPLPASSPVATSPISRGFPSGGPSSGIDVKSPTPAPRTSGVTLKELAGSSSSASISEASHPVQTETAAVAETSESNKPKPVRPPPAKSRPPRPGSAPKKEPSVEGQESVVQDNQGAKPKVRPPRPASVIKHAASKPDSKVQSGAPALPDRPGPGHPLFHYVVKGPHGIAMYDYNSSQPDELSFKAGDVIVLQSRIDDQWMRGKNGTKEGIFPANFMDVVEPPPRSAQQRPPVRSSPTPSSPGKGVTGPHCVARFDYEGEGEGDLTFSEGDVIHLVERVDDEWVRGSLQGRTGLLPVVFVEIMEDLPAASLDIPTAGASSPKGDLIVTALYDFSGQEGELSFKAGAKIKILSQVNTDWLLGEHSNKTGTFPASFVDRIPQNLPAHQESSREGSSEPEYLGPKESIITEQPSEPHCVAKFDFAGDGADDLPFKIGDRIALVAHVDDDWLMGKLGGRDGMFPKTFVDIIQDLTDNHHASSHLSDAPAPPQVAAPVPAGPKPQGRALFDYVSQTDGDLTFSTGEVVDLEEKVDDDWMKGSIGTRSGMFPCSFVEILHPLP